MAITEYLKSRKDICKKLIVELRKKYEYVSILGVDTYGISINVDRFTTNISESRSTERGFVIKVYDGNGYLEYSVDDINQDNFKKIVKDVKNFEVQEVSRVKAKVLADDHFTNVYSREDENPLETEDILKILSEIKDNTIAYDDKIINAMCGFEKLTVNKFFLTENKDLEQDYPWCVAMVYAVARRDNNIKAGREFFGDVNSKKALTELKKISTNACKLAIELLDCLTIEPGVYDVITDPSIYGLIAHEAFGHGVEMDMFVKNRAKAKDYMGEYVASPIVSMHDGAAATLSVASYFFDDDGILASDTEIIRDGILVGGMADALSAMQLDVNPTGNGRRETFTHKAYTRMTNTFFTPGKDKLEDMIKSIDYGFYLCETNNGMEDPKNWQIQCVCEYAREIKDGKFTGRIFSPVVLSGYVLDVLKSITMVSDEFKVYGSGYCGKGHKEWVRVSDGGPHLKARVKLG